MQALNARNQEETMFTANISNTTYINSNISSGYIALGKQILEILNEDYDEEQALVILCIGTDRATGDCLGPLVGEQLKNRLHFSRDYLSCTVYGNLETPVHAVNLEETIESIYRSFKNPYVIAIDASLGATSHIGYATISPNAILPGKGVQKKLPAIGDLSITGIVNLSGFSGSALLQSTRLFTVVQLSKMISNGIYYALRNYTKNSLHHTAYLDSPL